jgi:prepilin-type N-terminal cleavage/methylation domain-containing protein
MNNLRTNRKKGFTLVEIIVVLVIIAILMAALAPVMIGWIREARDSTIVAEARVGLVSIQALITDARSRSADNTIADQAALVGGGALPEAANALGINARDRFNDLIGDLTAANFQFSWGTTGTITGGTYTSGNRRATYVPPVGAGAGTWVVAPAP